MSEQNKKKSAYQTVIEQLSGIFFPVINLITAASIIKSAMILLAMFGVLTTDSGIYRLFYAVSDGFFYFLPFFLAITAAKQWKTDPFITMMIAAAMLYPDLTAYVDQTKSMLLFGIEVPHAVYQSGVIPILLAVGLLHFVEIPCDKYIPEVVRGFLKPIICCLILIPATFLLFGPMGSWIGDGLTNLFFRIYDWNPVLAGAFMGFVIQPMVAIGAHWSIVPVCISNIALYGYDVIMPLVAAAVYAQGGAALAVAMMCKKDKTKRQMAIQASATAVLGVSEPALFGINVPLVRPMIAACFSGAIGGALVGTTGAHCLSFAFPSIVTSVAFVGPGFGMFLFTMLQGFVLGFVFTYLQKKHIQVA